MHKHTTSALHWRAFWRDDRLETWQLIFLKKKEVLKLISLYAVLGFFFPFFSFSFFSSPSMRWFYGIISLASLGSEHNLSHSHVVWHLNRSDRLWFLYQITRCIYFCKPCHWLKNAGPSTIMGHDREEQRQPGFSWTPTS